MGYRSTQIRVGDTLKRIALREMGSAEHWVDIALLNHLLPPYIGNAGERVARPGATILLPVEAVDAVADTDDPFLSDAALPKGFFAVEDGDIALVSGVHNLVQTLGHRITVLKRSMLFHPEYGCWVRTLQGARNGPEAGGLAAFYVKSSLLEDARVSGTADIQAEVVGDSIRVTGNVLPIYGKSIAFNRIV